MAALNWGIIPGRRRSGGAGIGDGGSNSTGMRFISLVRLRDLLELWWFRAGFLYG